MVTHRNGVAALVATAAQNDWLLRVLGVRPGNAAAARPGSLDPAVLETMTGKVGKLAAMARPTQAPKTQATSRLLGAIGARKAPDDPMEAASHIAQLVPGFLATMEQERPIASKPLSKGEKVDSQDQLLGMADLFAAAQRSLVAWESLLEEAEQTSGTIDTLEAKQDRDEDDYADALGSYKSLRKQAIEAEAQALPLMAALQDRFNKLSADQQQAAGKEAGRG